MELEQKGLSAYLAELIGTLLLVFFITSVVTLYVSVGSQASFGTDFAVVGFVQGLTLFGTFPFTNGAGAVDARLSPDGKTLSVTGGRGLVVSTFAVNGGTVTELPSSPVALPAGTSPTGLVVL